jgi:hypothetical protein
MGRKNALAAAEAANAVEVSVVSNYVRLCIGEGVTPEEAFKTIRQKLRSVKEIKIQAATT